jgi:hypothetical protein
MKRSTRVLGTAALACSAFAALAVVAAAHTARFNSIVTISFQPGHGQANDTFSGMVVSRKGRCQRHRAVVVRRRVVGPDLRVGATFTDRDGHWEVLSASTPTGTYFAKARRKVLRHNSRHLHVCKAAISNDLQVGHGKPHPHGQVGHGKPHPHGQVGHGKPHPHAKL